MTKICFLALILSNVISCALNKSTSTKDNELSTLVKTDRNLVPTYEVKGKYIYRFFCTPIEKKPFCDKWEVMSLGSLLSMVLTPERIEKFWQLWDEERNQQRKKRS